MAPLDADPEPERAAAPSLRARALRALPLTAFLVAVALVCIRVQFLGHDWGDDFALYINQAKGLVKGTVAQVVTDNRYAVDNSGSSSFSPYVYPWGFPILLAPLYALFDLDYGAFKFLGVVCLCTFLGALHRLAKPRMHPYLAGALVLLFAVSVEYTRWTDSVTSDFASLAFVGLSLLVLDRCRRADRFLGARLAPLVGCGLLLGWTMSIRRETVVLFGALAVQQLWPVLDHLRAARRAGCRPAWRTLPWRPLAAPWLAALGLLVGLQLALPSSLTYDTTGGGWHQLQPNLIWYRDVLADLIGLHQHQTPTLSLFGHQGLGEVVFGAVLVLAAIGLIGRLVRAGREDAPIAVVLVGLIMVVGRQPFHEARYLFTIAPLLLYFTVQAIPTLVARRPSPQGRRPDRVRRWVALAPLALLAPMAQSNWNSLYGAIDYHGSYQYVVTGPESQVSTQMFAAVRKCTRGDDVVLFSRARAMNLYTGRRSIQTSSLDQALQRADFLVVNNGDLNYYEPAVGQDNAASLGLARVWHNDEYSLYLVHPDRPGGSGPCVVEI